MTTVPNGEEKKVIPPAVAPAANGDQDTDFDEELKRLENGGSPAPIVAPKGKTKEEELKQAIHTAKHLGKRIKDLGGDPVSALGEDAAPFVPAPESSIDTSKFVTKEDLAATDARKLAQTEGEFKVIMWYVKNNGMSVEDAHLLANKGKLKKTLSEINRSKAAIPSNGGGGPGGDRPVETDAPELPEEDKRRLAASGMIYDPAKKAYVGKRVQYRFDGKGWVNEKISK